MFYKIWFQCLQEVLGFIADLSWYIALQRKITNVYNMTNADANIRTCTRKLRFIREGPILGSRVCQSSWPPGPFHNTSRRMSTGEVLGLGPLSWSHCFPSESRSDLGKHCWSRQIAELEGGRLSARECRLLNFRNTNLSAGYVGWGDEWGHCTLAPN